MPPAGESEVTEPMADRSADAQLARDLVDASVLRGRFVLRSGAVSEYYIDKYLFTTSPDLLQRLAGRLADLLPSGVDRIAGTELGAVPLATALSLETGLPSVIVRKGMKEYGTAKPVEGRLNAGERVVLVEDVVTTGGAAIQALATLRSLDAEVLKILAVVDREEGGAEAIQAEGVPFEALFGRSGLELTES